MTEKLELCGYTLEKFNILMGRAARYFPIWANHIKMNMNCKTKDRNGEDLNQYSEIWAWDETIFGDITKSLSSVSCCIVGETHNNSNTYLNRGNDDEYCPDCEDFCEYLYNSSRRELWNGSLNHITRLETLEQFVDHLDEYHKDLIK